MFQRVTDPWQLSAKLTSRIELIPTVPGPFVADVAAIDLPSVSMRSLRERVPRIAHVQRPAQRVFLAFVPEESDPPVLVNGAEFGPGEVLLFGRDCPSHNRRTAPGGWVSLSVPSDALEDLSQFAGQDLTADADAARIAAPGCWGRLSRLHGAMVRGTTEGAELTSNREALRGLDQLLLCGIADAMSSPMKRADGPGRLRHKALLERFRCLLDENIDRALYLPEVCAALGISHRTLTHFCHEYLGMAPKKYFCLRRMHMARRALLDADSACTTVTEIATRYGFWELGRFSVLYRQLYAEKPSETFRRRPMNASELGACESRGLQAGLLGWSLRPDA